MGSVVAPFVVQSPSDVIALGTFKVLCFRAKHDFTRYLQPEPVFEKFE